MTNQSTTEGRRCEVRLMPSSEVLAATARHL